MSSRQPRIPPAELFRWLMASGGDLERAAELGRAEMQARAELGDDQARRFLEELLVGAVTREVEEVAEQDVKLGRVVWRQVARA